MTSYLRSIFGGGSSSSRHAERDRSKSHTRSRSVPVPTPQVQVGRQVPTTYIYTSPSAVSSTSNGRSHSPTTFPTRPSPLRYNTYDSSTVKSQNRSGSSGSRPRTPSGTVSYKSGDKYFPYPIYTPSASSQPSSRSNSNSSIYPPSSTSINSHQSHYTPAPPRTSSSGSVASRPALKQTHTWHAGQKPVDGPRPHVSFVNPKRAQTLHMHPLLAASHHSRAPISYDVMYAPSSRTIVDRNTRTSVPSHTLTQSATDPPTSGQLVLRSDKFPWTVVVQAGSASSQPKSAAKFYIGSSTPKGAPVSNLDVLHAVYNTLNARVTKEEWNALGTGSRAQRKATKAYENRCRATGGGWDQGVKRIDWLGGKTRLIGVEVDKAASETGVGKLVFGKP
ncbi:hypothetical protein WG66_006426 [Moniliophthora roreri]|uniref:DUF6699 domain-containing protein n=1 Tax=Moniliophthora roreri TaxID=221103 RepID=A0A0W0EUZ5_MONRR|nr:hypothetical protein WG66_006426 [Moniliophthora roreri]